MGKRPTTLKSNYLYQIDCSYLDLQLVIVVIVYIIILHNSNQKTYTKHKDLVQVNSKVE